MARTLITPTTITRAGVAPPAEASGDVSNGNYTFNDSHTVILVRNSNGASTARTMSIPFNSGVDGQTVTPRTYSIAAGASRYVGPFDVTTYGTQLKIDSDNAELKYIVLQMP